MKNASTSFRSHRIVHPLRRRFPAANMTTRLKDDVQKLYEFWCELAAPANVGDAGRILDSYPPEFADQQIMSLISDFAYPCELPKNTDSILTFSFVLTTMESKFRFGFCRHDPRTRTAMVVLTYLPWHDVFTKFLNVLGELRTSNPPEFEQFLREAYVAVPEPGACLKLYYRNGTMPHFFQRPAQFLLPSMPENNNLNMYYNFVEPKNMIAVFAAMLAERRIVFTSAHLDRLSACVQSANSFLYPMSWEHIFVPILPQKMRDTLSATMPYLIGVPVSVLQNMSADEVGDIVILNCDEHFLQTRYDDVKAMPAELVAHLKKHLSNTAEHIGNRVSRIFLGVLVQLIGGYRDGIKFPQGERISFDAELFLESKAPHIRGYLRQLMQSQLFQQFIDGRLRMLETGEGISDEFEMETVRHSEKMTKKGKQYKDFLRNVKDKTNPAVKSAVQSVRKGGHGVKAAYKDLRGKLRDKPGSASSSFNESVSPMSQSHHFEAGSAASGPSNHRQHHSYPAASRMHSAPNSPMKLSNSSDNTAGSGAGSSAHSLRPHRSGSFDNASQLHPPTSAAAAAPPPPSRPVGSAPLVTPDSMSLHSMRLLPGPRRRSSAQAAAAAAAAGLGSDEDSLHSVCSPDDELDADDDDDDAAEDENDSDRRFDSPPEQQSPPVPTPRSNVPPQRPPPPHPSALAGTMQATGTATTKTSVFYQSLTPSKSATNNASNHHPPHNTHHQSSVRHQSAQHSSHAQPVSSTSSFLQSARVPNPTQSAQPPAPLPPAIGHQYQYQQRPHHHQHQQSGNGFENDFVVVANGGADLLGSTAFASSSSALASVVDGQFDGFSRHSEVAKEPPPTSPNLINLDTSFDVEDFDPLNQNARKLPPLAPKPTIVPALMRPLIAAGSSGTANPAAAMYRPVYPARMPGAQQQQQQQRAIGASVGRTTSDADVELLRKYGLDKFSLSTSPAQAEPQTATSVAQRRDWTGFD